MKHGDRIRDREGNEGVYAWNTAPNPVWGRKRWMVTIQLDDGSLRNTCLDECELVEDDDG